MLGQPPSFEEIENLRRSVAMLPPAHPTALDRETALAVLSALVVALRRLGER